MEGLEKEDYYLNKFKSDGWNLVNKAKTGKASGSLGTMRKRWTTNLIRREALKYDTKMDFLEGSPKAYQAAQRNGLLKEFYWLKKRNKHKDTIDITPVPMAS